MAFASLRDIRILQQCWWSSDLIVRYALWPCKYLPAFRRSVLHSSSG